MTADPSTLDYYDRNAVAFVEGTVGARMDDALQRFAALLPDGAHVLDWGCGSGRDSRALREMGYVVTSVDASAAMAEEGLKWNCTYENWGVRGDGPRVAYEVDCIHSTRGCDLSCADIVISNDLHYDPETGVLSADKDGYYDRNGRPR